MTSFLRTRILFSFALGLFVLTASSAMADVTYNSDAGTFTGAGTYSGAVNATKNLTATPTTGQTITFTSNIVSTGNFTQNGAFVVFDTGTVNSFNTLSINNSSGGNNEKMTLRGAMTLTGLGMGNTSTVYLDVEDGAALTVSGVAYLNQANGARGVITQTGGTVSFTTSGNGDIRIGHWPNATYPSRYDISGGSLSIPNTTTYVGWDGYAEMNISGGEVSLKCLSLSNGQNQGKGTLRLTGGTLNIGDGGIVRNKRNVSGSMAAEVYLGQGTIHATATQTWGSNLTMSLYGRSATDTADVAGGVTTFNADSGKTITIPSTISGVGALTKTGAGTLTLSGANTYSGGTAINAGTLKLTNSATMSTGTVTVASDAILEIAPSSNWTWNGGNISGDGTLKVSSGTFTMPLTNLGLSAANGNVVVDGASLTINNNQNATAYYSGVNIDINNGGSVTFNRSGTANQIWLSNNPTFTFGTSGGGSFNTPSSGLNFVNDSDTKFVTTGGAKNTITGNSGFNLHSHNLTFDVAQGTDANGVDLEVSALLWNGNGIVKNGAGTMALTYANTYSGATTINAGTLKLSGSGKMGNGSGVVSIASGATLTFASDLTQTTIANPISGAGKIIKDGTNTVNINGTFTSFTGDMTINGGTLSVKTNGAVSLGLRNISGSGDLEIRLVANNNANTQIPNLVNQNFTGVISLVKADPNVSSLKEKFYAKGKTYEGFTFNVGDETTLYFENAALMADVRLSGFGNSENYGALRLNNNMEGKITVVNNALLGINGSRTVSGEITSGAANGTVNLNIQANGSGTSNTFSGDISDSENSTLGLSIIRRTGTSNTSTFTFTGNLSYSGATNVAAGQTMVLSGANANLKNSSDVTVNGALDFTGYTGENAMQLNNLSGTNGVIVGTGKDLILNNDDMSKFIGSITAKEIVKTGDGTLQIYTGATGQVDAQSLVVSSGNLDFKGYMTGGITVDANAVFSPGNSIGEATYGGGYILNDGATLLMEIGGSTVESNDSLYNTTADGTLTINGMIDLVLASNSTLKGGDEFVAVLSGSNSGDDGFADYLLSKVNSYYFTNLEYVQLDGSYGAYSGKYAIKGILDKNAVPEPSTWALLALGAAGLMYWRKRKN